ncbi:hypothetical protein [Gilvimarinus agarilyticus]|uniref:hypothetical protein n=1 Tax=Gilvimarinus agarilyticus TaxID=679259 RepID=UPI0005A239E7|nr:hypothetical protein [Gilvimarinus agarilyticus]
MTKLQRITAWLTFIGAVLTFLPALWGFIEWLTKDVGVELNPWENIASYYSLTYGWLFDTHRVPTWELLILFAALAYLGISIVRLFYENYQNRAPRSQPKPDYFQYQVDTRFEVNWEWRWNNTETEPQIEGLHPICPECSCEIVFIEEEVPCNKGDPIIQTKLVCTSCETQRLKHVTFTHSQLDLIEQVAREIRRKVRTGEWKIALDLAHKPTFARFTEMAYQDINWRWEWHIDQSEKGTPIGLKGFCPHCDCELTPHNVTDDLGYDCVDVECPSCIKNTGHGMVYRCAGDDEELWDDVTKEIERLARSNKFKGVPKKADPSKVKYMRSSPVGS